MSVARSIRICIVKFIINDLLFSQLSRHCSLAYRVRRKKAILEFKKKRITRNYKFKAFNDDNNDD